ncbi:carboxypeptidase-like regulatory domain-containing protein [Aquimarina litoralis]|uniref:carboxypeptidase-like regulatory domain-containing protein n=1 Tax=Aquimarina litoralis TaxID=584605 RepID=UPI001C59AF2A|nr:carboxypeptidase-like regulatory domain-containing protein [Aquimarina litoralis]MBW1297396.1 TonB-dependent receptor plug domain-containing protein [Aquimarina litoralis]
MGKYIIIIVTLLCSVNLAANHLITNEESKKLTIYWDASFSQKDKNIAKEFQFLEAFFKVYPNTTVNLVVVNSKALANENVEIKSADWSTLKQKINTIQYDGTLDLSLVNTKVKADFLFFFTDGKSYFGELERNLYSPKIYTISSTPDINKKFLHETSFFSLGYHIDLQQMDADSGVKAIKENKRMIRLEFVTNENTNSQKKYIEGIVTDGTDVLPNVNIVVEGKNRGTITDQNGGYKITVDPGDVLIFSSADKEKVTAKISPEDNFVDIKMTDNVNNLDAVIIKSKVEKEREKVYVGLRKEDKNALGYSVQSTDVDDPINLGQALAGKFAGVKILDQSNLNNIRIRTQKTILGDSEPQVYIDDVPVGDQLDLRLLDSYNIKSVRVLKGFAATNLYGSVGVNGIILITTKGGKRITDDYKEDKSKEEKIPTKVFTAPLIVSNAPISNFVTLFKKESDYDKAYEVYLRMRDFNKDNVTFFVECADYFFDNNQQDKGILILSNLIELFPNNTSVLKILAFNLEKRELFDHARKTYQRIVDVSPLMSQAYLDLANNYASEKQYQKSVDLFKKITKNKISEIESFRGLKSQIENDFKHLLSKRNQKWRTNHIDQKYFTLPKYDLRVVTEWSHPIVEFEMQYIDPKKQYAVLSHTMEKDKETINRELASKYTSDEYIITNTDKGDWYLNIKLPNNYKPNIKAPKFLKVKLYTKFGTPQEKLQTHLINIDRIVKNRIFTSFKL